MQFVNEDKSTKIQKYKQFTLDDVEGENNAEKRRKIKKKLDKYNFGVNGPRITRRSLDLIPGLPGNNATGKARLTASGITLVKAYYDATDKTGVIKQGKPVVFDTVTGIAVTGIHDSWQVDEYKVVGISLINYARINPAPGRDIIPINLLQPGSPKEQELYIVKGRIPGRFIDSNGDEVLGRASCQIAEIEVFQDEDAQFQPPPDDLRLHFPDGSEVEMKFEQVYNLSKKLFDGLGIAKREFTSNKLIIVSEDWA